MKAIVEGFSKYEGSKKSYCESHKIKPHVFDYYRKKLNGFSNSPATFVPIQINQPIPLDPLEVYYPNGNRLVLSLDTPRSLIIELVQISIDKMPSDV